MNWRGKSPGSENRYELELCRGEHLVNISMCFAIRSMRRKVLVIGGATYNGP
jgi:hypothetical protein